MSASAPMRIDRPADVNHEDSCLGQPSSLVDRAHLSGAAGAFVASLKLTGILGAVAWAFCFANSGLFFPLVLGIWWKRANRQGAIAGMVLGFGAGLAYLINIRWLGGAEWFGIDHLRFGIIGMPVSLVAMIVVSLMTEEPDAETQAMVDEMRIPSGETVLSAKH